MMEIKILGTGCPNCRTLEQRVRRVLEANQIEAKVTKVEEIVDIMAYKVMATPALVIDEEVLVKGRVPKESDILNLIKERL